jgi:DNA-binding CsgD family transcriptional regulator
VRELVDTALTRLAGTAAERRIGGLLVHGLWAEAELSVVATARRDDADLVQANADRILTAVSKLCAEPEQQAHAAVCHALAADIRGGAFHDAWTDAVTRWQNVGQPFQVAFAQWRFAETLLRQSASGARLLRDAHRSATALGALALQTAIAHTARRHRIELAEVPPAPPPSAVARTGLTARELEILSHLRAGRSNGEIAAALVISPKTVSVHVTNILRKLNVTRRADAARAIDLLEAER